MKTTSLRSFSRILALLIFLPLSVPADQHPVVPLSCTPDNLAGVSFSHLTVEQGLSNSHVYDILQDDVGFIWIATFNGLNRFDGYSIKSYHHDPSDPSSLSGSNINTIFQGRDGYIWVGTDGRGLDRFDPKTETAVHHLADEEKPGAVSSNIISAITQDPDGFLWIGTGNGVLNRFDPTAEIFTAYALPERVARTFIAGVHVDSQGALWIAADKLYRFDPGTTTFTSFAPDQIVRLAPPSPSAPPPGGPPPGGPPPGGPPPGGPESIESQFDTMLSDGTAGLWLGSIDGLFYFDFVTHAFEQHVAAEGFGDSTRVLSIIQSDSGLLWLTTPRNVHIYDPETRGIAFSFDYDPENPLGISAEVVNLVFRSRDGVLWFGTQDAGVDILNCDQARFTAYPYDPNDRGNTFFDNHIKTIYEDPKGILWVTTGPFINRFDPVSYRFEHIFPASLPLPAMDRRIARIDGFI
ncbi:MAG: two-component regulator propeller domain-containing protein, partial [Desulfobacterales bacterium]